MDGAETRGGLMRDPVVRMLFAAIAIVGAHSLVLGPIAPAIAASFPALVPADVTRAFGAFGAGTALSAFALAPLGDRFGADRSLLAALALFALAMAAAAAAPGFAALVAAEAAIGVGTGLAIPAIYALAAHTAPPGRAAETLGLVLTGWTLSLILGVFLAGVVADLWSWRAVFAGFALIAAAVAAVLARRDFGEVPRGAAAPSPLAALAIPGALRGLGRVVLFMLGFYGVWGLMGAQFDRLGLSTSWAGLAALAYGTGFGVMARFDAVIDRLGHARVAPPLFAAIALAYGLMALISGSGPALIAFCLLWGALNHFALGVIIGLLAALAPERRATLLGLNSTATYLALFLGTMIWRPVFLQAGFAAAALLAGALMALAAIEAAFAARRARRPR